MAKLVRREDLERIRKSGRILGNVLAKVRELLTPGISTSFIEEVVREYITRQGARPAFLGYRGFPAALCISINNEVVHGIPRDRVIRAGDLVSIDVGVEFEGFYTDAAFSVVVGNGNPVAQRLVEVTRRALYAGIRQALPGKRVGDISHAIQTTIEREGFSVVRDLVGHGVGRSLHEDPQIPNFGQKGQGTVLEEGMVLAIEPMANEKGYRVKVLEDGWTVVTEDGGLSAHFEHTILVRRGQPEILTLGERGDSF
ncbi:MAG: type I methionyl aminopeptidase [Candidatus Caldatribacterium sp.]|nr:type I methionyl aminopeptidase [Candidatus Caldatribacterium sp.]